MAASSVRRVLFVTWDGGGNVNPLLALGPRLATRGWDVHAYGPPSLADRFSAAGIAYESRAAADPWDVTSMAGDVRDQLLRVGADAAVVDYMLPGAICGAEAVGRPTAVLVHTLLRSLLVDRAPGPIGMAASVGDVDAARVALGLGPLGGFGDLLDRCTRVLVTCPAELDMPAPGDGDSVGDGGRDGPPAGNVRYVGPVLEPAGADGTWARASGRPLVVVGLGTTPMDEAPVLQRVLAALADLPVEVVATVGDHLDPTEVAAAAGDPANATVTRYVRHAALLPGAALLVCHAGLGTVVAGLGHGVPLLCLPLGREQPDNAAAVERTGAGRRLAPDSTHATIRTAAADLLGTAGYRTAATAMAATIAAYDGRPEGELDVLVEASAPTGPPTEPTP